MHEELREILRYAYEMLIPTYLLFAVIYIFNYCCRVHMMIFFSRFLLVINLTLQMRMKEFHKFQPIFKTATMKIVTSVIDADFAEFYDRQECKFSALRQDQTLSVGIHRYCYGQHAYLMCLKVLGRYR